ncbi:hypothetical protein EYF80_044659 [Liparis tanakae]|uniref:Uncharacterized protein n=1 Tax=Liparis tanakae TaxID=230148 RepID=A0A4Z2FW37_9TELE|nr:hypothetical protein EYF80_044659 [Liparis tanakae]
MEREGVRIKDLLSLFLGVFASAHQTASLSASDTWNASPGRQQCASFISVSAALGSSTPPREPRSERDPPAKPNAAARAPRASRSAAPERSEEEEEEEEEEKKKREEGANRFTSGTKRRRGRSRRGSMPPPP